MPGYEVLGFSGSWVTTDALHCRTMGITDRYMLYIHHIPLHDPVATQDGFLVEAEVIAYSGQSLINNTPKVYWKTDGGWNGVEMAPMGGNDFAAYIPNQPQGTPIYYYINAQDGSGRDENHPYIGAPGAHLFLSTSVDPLLGADASQISAGSGGQVNFALDAGASNAYRNYLLLATASGTSPGIPLPGGLVTLPLNWDAVTDLVLLLLNTSYFVDFMGQLDGAGEAAAQLNVGPLPSGCVGTTLHFAYALNPPWDFVSDSLAIEIVD
jgi:hypothetical protein